MADNRIREYLARVYGPEPAARHNLLLESMLAGFRASHPQLSTQSARATFRPQDAILITYGDMVHAGDTPPLRTLAGFCDRHLTDVISAVHLLPFFPYSSDDGFSVIDYTAVDPALGTWDDVRAVDNSFRLMFDAVINHISVESDWFQGYLNGEEQYRNYFIEVQPGTDLSSVFRPRAQPLLTPFETAHGQKHIWTTFGPDQVDLNYREPAVLLEIISTLLTYVGRGARYIRLDAIAFLWKEIGTSCVHLEQTHLIIRLLRAVLDQVAPEVTLITETNVPHQENISYFGSGRDEAQMVYNFSLPPLTLHAFHTGQATTLSNWAGTLETPSSEVTFFNFLASHDGIGVTPARGLLSAAEIEAMAARVKALGGRVSSRTDPSGRDQPYELNINYLDALGDPARPESETVELMARRFLASQAIMLAMPGVPGIYFHSLFGSRGWPEGVQMTGRARTINRQKLPVDQIEAELGAEGSLRQRVFAGYRHMLRARAGSPAFDPRWGHAVRHLHPAVFAIWRESPDGSEGVLCLHNVSDGQVEVSLPAGRYVDLIAADQRPVGGTTALRPYQVMWLRRSS